MTLATDVAWREAERAWAAETSPENLERMARLAERAGVPRLLVYMASFRPCKGMLVRTHRGEGRVVGQGAAAMKWAVHGLNPKKVAASTRIVELADGTTVGVGGRLTTTRVLDPVSWLLTKRGQAWARSNACSACVDGGRVAPAWDHADGRKYCSACHPLSTACSSCGHIAPAGAKHNLFAHHSFCPVGQAAVKAERARKGLCVKCGSARVHDANNATWSFPCGHPGAEIPYPRRKKAAKAWAR